MKFITKKSVKDQNFSLVYRDEDYSFDVEPLEESGDTSIMINDLQLEIDHLGEIIYVWGYCPLIKYLETEEYPQKYSPKSTHLSHLLKLYIYDQGGHLVEIPWVDSGT